MDSSLFIDGAYLREHYEKQMRSWAVPPYLA